MYTHRGDSRTTVEHKIVKNKVTADMKRVNYTNLRYASCSSN